MRKIKFFSIFALSFLAIQIFSLVKINANNATLPTNYGVDQGKLVEIENSNIAYHDEIGHAYILSAYFGEDGVTITEDNDTLNVKGHVVELYRIKSFVVYADGTKAEVSRLFDSKEVGGLTTLDSNGYFLYTGDLGQSWVGKTVKSIQFQCYTTDKTTEEIGELQILGLALDADGTYNNYEELYVQDNGSTDEPEQGETETPNPEDTSIEYEFSSSNMVVENGKYTLEETGYASVKANFETLANTYGYVSVKYNASESVNFETYATVLDAENQEVETIVAGAVSGAWNVETEEYEGFKISTINISSYISTYVGYKQIKLSINASAGDYIEIFDFAITTDGVHGFDLTLPEPPTTDEPTDEPEQGEVETSTVQKVESAFVSDGKSTVDGNKYTLTDTRSYITADLSQMTIDNSKVFLTIKYRITSTAEGFETYVAGDGAGNKDASAVVAPNAAVSSPWNLKEHIIGEDCSIATLEITSYVSGYTKWESVSIRIKGAVGTEFVLYEVVITKDGVHGLDAKIEYDTPEDPEALAALAEAKAIAKEALAEYKLADLYREEEQE